MLVLHVQKVSFTVYVQYHSTVRIIFYFPFNTVTFYITTFSFFVHSMYAFKTYVHTHTNLDMTVL